MLKEQSLLLPHASEDDPFLGKATEHPECFMPITQDASKSGLSSRRSKEEWESINFATQSQ